MDSADQHWLIPKATQPMTVKGLCDNKFSVICFSQVLLTQYLEFLTLTQASSYQHLPL